MSLMSWTLFWKKLGIETEKRGLTVKKYKPANDKNALRKLGISNEAISSVYTGTLNYPDQLMFAKLSKFARRDIDAVMRWTKSSSKSSGFLKLFALIKRYPISVALSRYKDLHRIQQYSQKGEGLIFTAKNTTNTIGAYNPKELVRRLNIKSQSKYTYEGSTTVGQDRIISISKGPKSKPVLKFVKLIDKGSKNVEIAISMDSKREMAKTKDSLQRYFGSYLDSFEVTKNTTKLRKFLTTGETKNFTVTAVTYYDNAYKQSIFPAYSRFVNVLASTAYREKMKSVSKRELQISDIRITYNDKSISKPIRISFLSYRNNIIGAFLLKADDRNLSSTKVAKLKIDFKRDIGVPLNTFVKTEDLNDSALYKYFLQTVPKRDIQLELRSSKAMEVYKGLLRSNLLDVESNAEERSRFCVNNNCKNKFRVDWKRKSCLECGDLLIPGKRIVVNKIPEGNIIDYIRISGNLGSLRKLSGKLLNRKMVIGSMLYSDQAVELIPLTSDLKDNQLEVLAHRFTSSIIVTSLDNIDHLEKHGLTVVSLHDLVYRLEEDMGNPVLDKITEAQIDHAAKIHQLANTAAKRINSNDHYIRRNEELKNLGAELFEADCSVILDRVLGNSLWLGAKHRGKSVPDGFSAFPILDRKHGCIIWDAKFSQGKGVVMGNFAKNKNYIKVAKSNSSIKASGGLKGFVFLCNNSFPKKYEKKYLSLIKGNKIKLTFIQSTQLKLIFDHFARFEKVILNNSTARAYYVKLLEDILFLKKGGRSIEVMETSTLKQALARNEKLLRPLSAKFKLKL